MTRAQEPAELRPGLPPVELRRVHARWVDEDGDILVFSANGYSAIWEDEELRMRSYPEPADSFKRNRFRPADSSWSEVEALAAGLPSVALGSRHCARTGIIRRCMAGGPLT